MRASPVKPRRLLLACALLLALPALFPRPGAGAPLADPRPDSAFGVGGAMRWPEWGTYGRPAGTVCNTAFVVQ